MTAFSTPRGLGNIDISAAGGLYGLMHGVNNVAGDRVDITTAGTDSTLTAAQLRSGWIVLAAGASGGFTITLPATAAFLGLLNPQDTRQQGGTNAFSRIMAIKNLNVGQTGTVTIGDSSTTLTGTMTIATNTTRWFLLTRTAATTITIENLGSMSL